MLKVGLVILAALMLSSCTEEIVEENVTIEVVDYTKYEELKEKHSVLQNDYKTLQHSLELAKKDIKLLKEDRNVEIFELTAYSPFDDRNGLNSDGNPNMTRTGTKPGPGTMAVDPNVIPLGSRIVVIYEDGTIEHGRAEDTGGAIKQNRLDVFRHCFDEAMAFGRQRAVVLWFEE